MAKRKNICPECDSEEFVSVPNQYDILTFADDDFVVRETAPTNDKEKIYCRECGTEINVEESLANKRVTLITN